MRTPTNITKAKVKILVTVVERVYKDMKMTGVKSIIHIGFSGYSTQTFERALDKSIPPLSQVKGVIYKTSYIG